MLQSVLRRQINHASTMRSAGTLLIIRQPESAMEREGKLEGWLDSPLTDKGQLTGAMAGMTLNNYGFTIDAAFTSHMKRSIKTAWHVLEQTDSCNAYLQRSWKLNDRNLGALQGLTKTGAILQYGSDTISQWLSFDTSSTDNSGSCESIPPCNPLSPYHNSHHSLYSISSPRLVKSEDLDQLIETIRNINGESFEDVRYRVLDCWTQQVVPFLKQGETVLLVMHLCPMVALIQHIESTAEKKLNSAQLYDIGKIKFPEGVPLLYRFNESLTPQYEETSASGTIPGIRVLPYNGFFIGNPLSLRSKLR